MRALKLLHRILTFDSVDLWPWFLTYIVNWLQNATPSPFLTQFRFRLLCVIALGEGFKTSTQNFDLWLIWPLTYSFAISNPILIPFASCDSTRWGHQNFDTEFWPFIFICDLSLAATNSLMPVQRFTLPAGTYITHRVIFTFPCLFTGPKLWNCLDQSLKEARSLTV